MMRRLIARIILADVRRPHLDQSDCLRTVKLTSIFLAAIAAKVGIWSEPDAESLRAIAVDPFSRFALAEAGFRARNWLGPALVSALHLSAPTPYFVFHLILAIATASVILRLVTQNAPPSDTWALMLITAAVPGMAVAFFWVGNDAVTLTLFALAICLRRSGYLSALIAVLIGLNHFEHGVAAMLALGLWNCLERPRRRSLVPSMLSLVGLIIGRLIQEAIFNEIGVRGIPSRLGINVTNRQDLDSIKAVAFLLPLVAWSILGLGTVVILIASPLRMRLASCLGFLAVPSLIAFDQTRVFAITSLPVTVVALIESRAAVAEWVRRHRTLMIVMFVVTPWLWLDSWKISGSATPYTLLWILDRLVPGFELSTLPR